MPWLGGAKLAILPGPPGSGQGVPVLSALSLLGYGALAWELNLKGVIENRELSIPRAPGYLISRLLGYVTIEYIKPGSHYLGNCGP